MDALAALRLQLEWGVDEALGDAPVDRTASRAARPPQPARAPALPGAPQAGASLAGASLAGRAPTALAAPRGEAIALRPPARRAAAIAAACATTEALRAALAAFDGCSLAFTASNLVFADGNPEAGLMLVGEGPGVEEDRAGRPFVGPSGQLLDRMLASVGLDRTRLLITNLIPWRPPGNRNPTDDEVLICLPFLLRHIALVRPRRLVLLGALSTRAVLGGTSGIRRMRGRWQTAEIPGVEGGIPALPMFHPAYLLRTAAAKREAWADLRMLQRTINSEITAS